MNDNRDFEEPMNGDTLPSQASNQVDHPAEGVTAPANDVPVNDERTAEDLSGEGTTKPLDDLDDLMQPANDDNATGATTPIPAISTADNDAPAVRTSYGQDAEVPSAPIVSADQAQQTTESVTQPLPNDALHASASAGDQGGAVPPVGPPSSPAADDGRSNHREAKRQKMVVPLVSALLVGALVGGGTGAGVAVWGMNQSDGSSATTSSNSSGSVIVNNTAAVTQVTAAAAKASPSVVTISASDSSESGTGSGVILTKDGYILTNAHVATLDGATASATITATTSTNQILKAKLVGYDANSDLAVLKVSATNMHPATFADSNKVNVGDSVIAIGAPLGLTGSVTDGIVSALHRGITVQSSAVQSGSGSGGSDGDNNEGSQSDPFKFWGFGDNGGSGGSQGQATPTQSVFLSVIQTDAAINPGNSGGALLNSQGQVVGINVAIATASSSSSDNSSSSSGSIGVGFAIPASFAKRVANELIANGKATHGLLGATIGDSTSSYAGAVIKSLVSGGAAQQAGLKSGDVLTALDGSTVSNATDLTALVRQQPAKEKVTVTYARGGTLHTVDVTLGTFSGS